MFERLCTTHPSVHWAGLGHLCHPGRGSDWEGMRGARTGDRVGLLARNRLEYVEIELAAAKAGLKE